MKHVFRIAIVGCALFTSFGCEKDIHEARLPASSDRPLTIVNGQPVGQAVAQSVGAQR